MCKEGQKLAYLTVTWSKDLAVDDGTLPLCPSFTIRVLATGINYKEHIPTHRIFLPRIYKLQFICCHVFASGFKVISHVPIVIPTQTAEVILDEETKALILGCPLFAN